MLEELLNEATSAAHAGDWQKAERLVHQLAGSPDKGIQVAVKALGRFGKLRTELAIKVIHLIGYPRNESAIPGLIYFIGDRNLPGWDEALTALAEMGPDVVVPHLVRALLNKEEPYHTGQTWSPDVEGICIMVSGLDREYARRCCPAVNYILSQQYPPSDPEIDYLLDVVERAGNDQDYVLPTLLALAKKYQGSGIETRARSLIFSYKQETLETYRLLLNRGEI
jgi:hypothetical protein